MIEADGSKTIACRNFEEDLVLYYYREWQGAERDRVEKHLQGCLRCEGFLQELSKTLPLSDEADEPQGAFWEQYSREMHQKLAALEMKAPWWERFFACFTPWTYGAVVTAFGVILSLVLTFGGGKWLQTRSSEDPLPQEMQAVADDLEFLKFMGLIEVLDLLETVEPKNHGENSA